MNHPIAFVTFILLAMAVGAALTAVLVRRGTLARWLAAEPTDGGLTRIDAHLSGATPGLGIPRVTSAAMRRDVQESTEKLEARDDVERLDRILRDIRDVTGADETIFWRWIDTRETLVPSAWSTEDASRPSFFDVTAWSPLVRWSAEETVVHFAGDVSGLPVLASAPVAAGDRLLGVLTISAANGLALGREAGRAWLPRFAAQLASAIELLDLKRKYGRDLRQSEALLDAVQRLHEQRNADTLGRAVCLKARDVTSASAAVLVRWESDPKSEPNGGRGIVQSKSGDTSAKTGDDVDPDSLVGRACRERLPTVLSDATAATASRSAFGTPAAAVHSLAIVPILGEDAAIGAIVVEGAVVGDIGQHEARNIALLAALARGPLEIVWEIEEVSRRARTDGLTGLVNRRHLDQELKRIVTETDRFGGNCSALLVDLDHFKAVNDTHGHDAGDAVLRHVARLLSEGIRAVDVCARYGGEELAILLPQTEAAGAFELADRLRRRIEVAPVRYRGTEIAITASFGVATYPSPVPYGDWLLLAADRGLYEAKQNGRNRVKAISASEVTTDIYRARR